jgi:hypothetical protein
MVITSYFCYLLFTFCIIINNAFINKEEMSMATKEEIRPIYSELQGYLAQAPMKTDKIRTIYAERLWEQYNETVNELSKISEKDYNRYKIIPEMGASRPFVDLDDYRGKLGAIIARLHGQYFHDEAAPFSDMPSTNIHVNQQQSQTVQIEIAIEMTELITKKLSEVPVISKERSFLEKIKEALRTVRTVPQLITLLITTAQEFGLSIDKLKDLLG